jgi:hypothetical protein
LNAVMAAIVRDRNKKVTVFPSLSRLTGQGTELRCGE